MRSSTSPRALLLTAGLALGAALLCTRPTPSFARPARVEPPLEFQLQVGTHTVPVTLDEEFTVTLGGRVVRMTPRAVPDRLFDNAEGVRFRYPRDMTFSYDGSAPDVKTWTLDGGDCVLDLFRYLDPGMGADEVRTTVFEQVTAKFAGNDPELSKRKMVLGGRSLDCLRMVARVLDQPVVQELVAFPHGKDVCILSVQDVPTDDGEPSQAYRKVLALLARTFEFP